MNKAIHGKRFAGQVGLQGPSPIPGDTSWSGGDRDGYDAVELTCLFSAMPQNRQSPRCGDLREDPSPPASLPSHLCYQRHVAMLQGLQAEAGAGQTGTGVCQCA